MHAKFKFQAPTDRHDASVGEDLLGEVVDQLPVDEAVDAVADDLLALLAHLPALGGLDVGDLWSVGLQEVRGESDLAK